jgi:ATP-dependent 26S proteasome regulatory subunit
MNKLLIGDEEVNRVISHSNSFNLDELMLLIPPYSDDYKNIIVPQRFEETVASHIIAPYLEKNEKYKPPIYLAIKGAAGEGKTAQSIATCTQKGVYVIYVSASSLSGNHENDAKEKLQKIYNYALQLRTKVLTTIIIDDFHKGIANEDDNIKRTINTEILIGYMMNIAEHNGSMHIPIILTANDLSKIYAPLLRTGRADIFLWEPKPEEKREIVFNILNSFMSENDEIEFSNFFKGYCNENVAFFAQLKNQWRKKLLKQAIHNVSVFNETNLTRINNFVNSYEGKLTYMELSKIANNLLEERGK